MSWDGNINSSHTMQDEYELARELGVATLTTDDDGQMVAAKPDLDECPHCDGQGAYWDDQTGQPDSNGGSMVTCHVCRGEGTVDTSPCIACGAPSFDHDEGCPVAGEVVQR